MIRGLGALLIVGGCLGLGLWYRDQFLGRVKALERLEEILGLMAGQVRYHRAALPDCCLYAASQMPEPFSNALKEVADKMGENQGACFAVVFRESLEKPFQKLPLKPQDLEIFWQCIPVNGFADGQMQTALLEQGGRRLGDRARRLERENVEKCRMAVGLGALGGLLLLLALW